MNRPRTLQILVTLALSSCWLFIPGVQRTLERWQAGIEYPLRELANRSPKLQQNLKVVTIDSRSDNFFTGNELSLETWGRFLSEIAAYRPSIIILDSGFLRTPLLSRDELQSFRKSIGEIDVPILARADIATRPTKSLNQLSESRLLRDAAYEELMQRRYEPKSVDGSGKRTLYVYAASRPLELLFSAYGHNEIDSFHSFQPAYHQNAKGILPHLGLQAFRMLPAEQRSELPPFVREAIASEKVLPINYIDTKLTLQKQIVVAAEIMKDNSSSFQHQLSKGDIVYVTIDAGVSGKAVSDTPLGMKPSWLAGVSVVNAFTANAWIRPIGFVLLFWSAAILLLWRCSLSMTLPAFLGVWIGSLMGSALLGTMTFLYGSITLPWLTVVSALAISGVAAYGYVLLQHTEILAKWNGQFHGFARFDRLASSNAKDGLINVPEQRVSTVMFVDIAGFSLLAESLSPEQAFHELRELIHGVAEQVSRFDGIVNRTIGDSLLCYFDDSIPSQTTKLNQADRAVAAAAAIQNLALDWALRSVAVGQPFFPLRIGIHTGVIYFGDVGTTKRLDETLIGHGVRLAKSLENASDPFHVTISSRTKEMAGGMLPERIHWERRELPVKHFTAPIVCYQFDPVWNRAEQKEQVLTAFRKILQIEREEQRWMVPDVATIEVRTGYGFGKLENYSRYGLCFSLEQPLPTGALVSLSFESADGKLGKLLRAESVGEVEVCVRWSYAENSTFLHGCSFYVSRSRERSALLKVLSKYLEEQFPNEATATQSA